MRSSGLQAECDRLRASLAEAREALHSIAFSGMDVPSAMGGGEDAFYRWQLISAIDKARAALGAGEEGRE